jgi:hypothetical protein
MMVVLISNVLDQKSFLIDWVYESNIGKSEPFHIQIPNSLSISETEHVAIKFLAKFLEPLIS